MMPLIGKMWQVQNGACCCCITASVEYIAATSCSTLTMYYGLLEQVVLLFIDHCIYVPMFKPIPCILLEC